MIHRKFYLAVVLRVAVIIAASLVLAFNIYRYERFFTLLAAGVVILLAAWDLVRITNRFNRHLVSFFEAMKHEDHSFGLRKLYVPGYPVLSRYMDDLSRKLSRVYIDQEIQARFLGSLVDHVQVGLVAVESTGKVELFNQAAQKLLGLHRIGHIESLKERYPEFGHMLLNMKAGDQKMITLYPNEVMRHLSVRCGFFTSRRGQVHLYSFQDVEHEVEEAEMETWQKLIRVLTHEINNSISPIYSLSDSIRKKMGDMKVTPPNPAHNQGSPGSARSAEYTAASSFNRIDEGLQIIQDRSKGLLDFVDKFRSLTPRGSLNRENFPVNDLFYRVRILMQGASYTYPRETIRNPTQDPTLHNGIPEIASSVFPESLMLYADQKLLEQILINLVKNALEEQQKGTPENDNKKQRKITMKAYQEQGRKIIEVSDNGPGISRDQLNRIFTPFYTTKKQGSGVGLSLSRQIMRMHGGTISVRSVVGEGTTFRLFFHD